MERRLVSSVRSTALVALLGVSMIGLSGCTMSEDTEGKLGTAVCSSSAASIASLRSGGDGARLVAAIVRDNTDDPTVKKVAETAASTDADKAAWERLATLLEDRCKK